MDRGLGRRNRAGPRIRVRLGPELPAAAVAGEEHVSGIALIAVADTATVRAYLDSIAPLGHYHISRLCAKPGTCAKPNQTGSGVSILCKLIQERDRTEFNDKRFGSRSAGSLRSSFYQVNPLSCPEDYPLACLDIA